MANFFAVNVSSSGTDGSRVCALKRAERISSSRVEGRSAYAMNRTKKKTPDFLQQTGISS
jgi:hypothetical protein